MKERVETEFFRELFELRNVFDTIWRENEPPTPAILYHYTSASAAVGILKSRTLWATIASALNDERELSHGASVLASVLHRRAAAANSSEEHVLFSKQLVGFDYTRNDLLHAFAASLSAHEDDRAQWQLYADGAYGIALGFDGPAIARLSESQTLRPNYGLGRVLYEEKE